MKTRSLRILIVFTVFSLAITACALPTSKEAMPSSEKTPVAEVTAIPPTDTPVPTPTATPAPLLPIGLRQGLASLNSYQVTYGQLVIGPGEEDKKQTTTIYSSLAEGDRSHTQVTILNSTADNPTGESSTRDRYQIGSKICSLPADEDAESPVSENDPMAEEMANVVASLMDMTLYVDDPVLVDEQQVNGVQTRHYTFKVNGLGKKSGAEVTQSSGEYWSAIDGNYLVKYKLVLEMRSAPEDSSAAQVYRNESSYDLTMINEPITIEMPAECQ